MKNKNNKPKLQTEIFKDCLYGNYSEADLKIIHAKIDAFSRDSIDMVSSFRNMTFMYESEGKYKMAEIILNYRPEDHIGESRMYDFISTRARQLEDEIPNASKEDQDRVWAQAEDEWEELVK